MKTFLVLVVLLLSAARLLWAQAPPTSITDLTITNSILHQTTSDSCLVVGIVEYTPGSWPSYCGLVKVNQGGQILWHKRYDVDSGDRLDDFIRMPDEGFLLAVRHQPGGNSVSRIGLIRTNANGEVLWNRQYDSGGLVLGHDIIARPNSGALVVSTRLNSGQNTVVMLRVDSIGDTLWTAKYSNGTSYRHHDALSLSNGDFAISGYDNNTTGGQYRDFVARFDSLGNHIWSRLYDTGNTMSMDFYDLLEADNGSIIAAGIVDDPSTDYDGAIFSFDAQGNEQWSYRYNHLVGLDGFGSIAAAPNGGFVVSGTSQQPGFINWTAPVLIGIDSSGTLQWSRHHFPTDSLFLSQGTISPSPTGGYWVQHHHTPNPNNFAARVALTDSAGGFGCPNMDSLITSNWTVQALNFPSTTDTPMRTALPLTIQFDSIITSATAISATSLCVNNIDTTACVPDFIATSATICENDSIYLGGAWQNTFGFYIDTLQGAQGCDSIVSTQLDVYAAQIDSSELAICAGDSTLLFGQLVTQPGSYSNTLVSQNGCDSTLSVQVVFIPAIVDSAELHICPSDSAFLEGSWQHQTGIYSDVYQAQSNGCDSVIFTSLFVDTLQPQSTVLSFCEGDSVYYANNWISVPGSYADTALSANGCDSITIATISEEPNTQTTDSISIYAGDSIYAAHAWQHESGVYIDTIHFDLYCDSISTTVLTVLDTSGNGLGTAFRIDGNNWLFPNPTTGQLTIEHAEIENGAAALLVYSALGEVAYSMNIKVQQQGKSVLELPASLPPGYYTAVLHGNKTQAVCRIVLIR